MELIFGVVARFFTDWRSLLRRYSRCGNCGNCGGMCGKCRNFGKRGKLGMFVIKTNSSIKKQN